MDDDMKDDAILPIDDDADTDLDSGVVPKKKLLGDEEVESLEDLEEEEEDELDDDAFTDVDNS